jgi:hypothetical protein
MCSAEELYWKYDPSVTFKGQMDLTSALVAIFKVLHLNATFNWLHFE